MWPNKTGLDSTHLDAGADNAGSARVAILAMLRALIKVIDSRSQANGICELDADGKVPHGRIDRAQANGVCELGADGKVPPKRYRTAIPGKGLSSDADGKLIHGNTSTARTVTPPPGHVIRSFDIDQHGHVTAIRTGAVASLHRMNTTVSHGPRRTTLASAPVPAPPADPAIPAVGDEYPGTWVAVADKITTSSSNRRIPVYGATEEDGTRSVIGYNYGRSITKRRVVIYALR